MRVSFCTTINGITFEGDAQVIPGKPPTHPTPDRPGDPIEDTHIEILDMDITINGVTAKIRDECMNDLHLLSTIEDINEVIMKNFYESL